MMHHTRGPDGPDEHTTHALREHYAAPRESGYWEALERRVMARVAGDAGEWWLVFGGWIRAGIVAAGLAALVGGAALWQARTAEARVAYEAVIADPATSAEMAGTPRRAATEREATLRYLISH
jgi:hypothetical protein